MIALLIAIAAVHPLFELSRDGKRWKEEMAEAAIIGKLNAYN